MGTVWPCSLQSIDLATALISHQRRGQQRYGVRCARTYPTLITTSMAQDLNEKIRSGACMMR
jgi:hypothetical protein